ncbi:MAG: hypothetical protein Q9226_006753 [Calogaya cf. arnoldii]
MASTATQGSDMASGPSAYSITALSPVWSRTPREIVCMVIEESDRETLFNWSRTSKYYYNIAADIIWRWFCINDPQPYRSWNRTCRRIDALRLKTRFETKSPAQRVKDLHFFTAWNESAYDPVTQRRAATRCMTDALNLLPNLERVLLEVDVHPDGLVALKKNEHLQELVLRLWVEFFPLDYDDDQKPICSYTLDFASLAGLGYLQHLSIGRLTPLEVLGLAKAICALPLTKLRLDAAPPADSDDPRKSYTGTEVDKSPIQTLLETVKLSGGQFSGHLPTSLQSISIRNIYRPFRSSDENLLLATIHPGNVTRLDLCVIAPKNLMQFFRHARYPKLRSFAVGGCRHFLPDTAWFGLGLGFNHNTQIDPPDIPIHGSFLNFLRCHNASLEDLTIRFFDPTSQDEDDFSFGFIATKDNLKRLKDSDPSLMPHDELETSAVMAFGQRRQDHEARHFTGWAGCSRRHGHDEGFTLCFGLETEHCVSMGFIDDVNAERADMEEEDDSEGEAYEMSEDEFDSNYLGEPDYAEDNDSDSDFSDQ